MTQEEFELLQQRLRNSGLGFMKFLISENINYSTYTKWERRFRTKENATSKTEQTLAPVTISHTKCNNVVLIARFIEYFSYTSYTPPSIYSLFLQEH